VIADVALFFDAMLAAGVEVTRNDTGGLAVRGPAAAVRALVLQIRPRRAELLAHIAALERAAIVRVNELRADRTPTTPAANPHTRDHP
jgi:hypothetical protein